MELGQKLERLHAGSRRETALGRERQKDELVKDRGALHGMSSVSSALHLAGSLALAPPLLALSLPVEALASAAQREAVLTVAARRTV